MKTIVTIMFIALLSSNIFSKEFNLNKNKIKEAIERSAKNRLLIDKLNNKDFKLYSRLLSDETKEVQRMDSMIIDMTSITGSKSVGIFEYDNRGNNLSQIQYEVSAEGSLETGKSLYKYDSYRNVIEYESSYYDEDMGETVNDEKIQYIYINNELSEKIEFYDYGDGWELDYKTEFIYNQDGTIAEELNYSYYDEWELFSKDVHTYMNGDLTLTESFNYEGDEWIISSKTEYIYDGGNLIEVSMSDYDGENYEENEVTEYEYDENDRVISVKNYIILEYEGDLTLFSESLYTYDAYGNVITEEQSGISDENTLEFSKILKINYTFDLSFTKDDLLMPEDDEDNLLGVNFQNMPKSMTMEIWFEMLNDWLDMGISGDFYFSQNTISLNVEDIRKSNISVYPNPVSEKIIVNLDATTNSADMKLYDMTGKEVASQNLMMRNELNIETLLPGVYVYIINENGIPFSGKIIKE